MEIQQLRYFLAAAKARNYSQAAVRCFTSRQNLTHSIHALESELGVTLFNLSGNTPMLTKDGQRAAAYAQTVIDTVDAFGEAFAASDSGSDELVSLKVMYSMTMRTSSPQLFDLLMAFDGCDMHLDEGTSAACYEAVCADETDAAVVVCMTRDFPNCESALLARSRIRFLANEGAAIAQKDEVAIRDLDGIELCLVPDYAFAYKEAGLDTRNICAIADFSFAYNRILNNDALCIVSRDFKPPEGTKLIRMENIGCAWDLYLLYNRKTSKHAVIRKLMEHLEENITFAK